jgi:hypothetical protein
VKTNREPQEATMQTLVPVIRRAVPLNHNETLIRTVCPAITYNHNETVVVACGITTNHNETLVRVGA